MASSEIGGVTLSWDPPESDGETSITAYHYRYKTDGEYGDWLEIPDSASLRSHRISRLAATPHTFQLAAENSSGLGLYSDEVTRTPLASTTPPRLEAQTVDGSVLRLDFDEDILQETSWPLSHKGLSVKVGGVARAITTSAGVDTDLSILVVTLVSPVLATDTVTVSYAPPARPPDTNYPLRDWAGNYVAAFTDVAVRNLTRGKPEPPTDFRTEPAGSGQLKLIWTPGFDGNSTLTGHQYRQKTTEPSFGQWMNIPESGARGTNARSYTLDNLTDGTLYTFQLRAMNAQGESGESDEATGTPRLGTLASAPRNVGATPGKPSGEAGVVPAGRRRRLSPP